MHHYIKMKGGKLFELLKSLSKTEFKDFKKVVCSPIYNTNERMLLLYEALKPQFPHFDISGLGKEKLFAKAFPGESFNNYKIHRLFTQMTQVLEEYLILLEHRSNTIERKKKLVQIYSKRNLKAFFDREVKLWSEELSASPFGDIEYYQQQLLLNDALYFHPLHNKYDANDKTLDHLINSLDHYFILAKMRYGLSLKNRERILNKPAIWRFAIAIQQEAQQDSMKEHPLFQLYQLAFLLLDQNELSDFSRYEKLLFKCIDQFPNDAKILFFSGLNYVNRQVNQGVFDFSKKALEWYQFGLKKELLLDKGKLNEVTFGNIVTYGCREKKFTWTNKFMENYAHLLEDKHREEVLAYHIGVWHFYQQHFSKTYAIIMNFAFPDSYFLKSRLLAIRAVFENFLQDDNYYELLFHQIKAFKQGMKRNKIFSSNAMEPVLNCVNLIGLFAKKIYEFEDKKNIKKELSTLINHYKKLAGKTWLLEKINEI